MSNKLHKFAMTTYFQYELPANCIFSLRFVECECTHTYDNLLDKKNINCNKLNYEGEIHTY